MGMMALPPQEQQEPGERRRFFIFLMLGVLTVLALFLWFFGPTPLVAGRYEEAEMGKLAALSNVVLVGWNGTQTFAIWAYPGVKTEMNVVFCNAAREDVVAELRLVEIPQMVRRFWFYLNGTGFGYREGNLTGWRHLFRQGECVPARLEVLVDGRSRPGVYVVRGVVESR